MVAYTNVKNARTRKSILFIFLLSFFMLYLASKYLLPAHRHFHPSHIVARPKTSSCLDKYLERWNHVMEASDAVIKEIPESTKENRFYSFSGNGYVGFSADGAKLRFYFLNEKEFYESSFVPVIRPVINGVTEKRQAIILNVKEGFVQLLSTYILNRSCIAVTELFNAHRKHQSLFQQEVTISNDGPFPVTVMFQLGDTGKGNRVITRNFDSQYGQIKYTIVEGLLKTDYYEAEFSTGFLDFQPFIQVPQKSMNKVNLISITRFNITKSKVKPVKRKQRNIEEAADTVFTKNVTGELVHVSKIRPSTFHKQHIDTWDDIWKIGVTIASDNDPDSPSSLHVNLTEYYIYSIIPLDPQVPQQAMNDCFSGPPTIHNAELWVIPSNIDSLFNLKERWYDLFKSASCATRHLSNFISVRESIVLSFLGLQYKKHHLQLALNPLNLRSNISIHDFSLHQFHSTDVLNIRIFIGHKSHEHTLFVTCIGKHNPVIYGCSTACEYIVALGNSDLKFPVHTTNPVTPLFYISTNRSHLEKLGKTEFMKAAKLNAKLTHHLSNEPHHLKLSPKFWLAVIILIVSFHVIVIKMIYNECRKQQGGIVRRR